MASRILRKLERVTRRLVGFDRLMAKHDKTIVELYELRHRLDRVSSLLDFAKLDESRMKASSKYKAFHSLIPPLSPMQVEGGCYRRVGKSYDGGYVMLDNFSSGQIDAAYSLGINKDVSWDEEIAALGIDVYMYDHTINRLPKTHPRFHFFREGVTGSPGESGLQTLTNLVRRNGHEQSHNLLLKMDIEGHEWSVFDETSSAVLNQFSQITLEFHDLDPGRPESEIAEMVRILKKLNQTHQSIHVHANGWCPISWLGDLALPLLLEVTYIRRSDYEGKLVANERTFPTELDQPTHPWLPDIPLGKFSTDPWSRSEER